MLIFMNSKNNPFILIIYGPTGVGKTDIALSIGQHMPVEIINMDVGQFYTPMSIGTAKPDWKNCITPHHLFDIINEPKNFSVAEYRMMLLKKIHEIKMRGNVPIVVGGSSFYLRSIFFPLNDQLPNNDIIISAPDNSWQTLYDIDPKRALGIEKTDVYRIERALEIWQKTGCKPTVFTPHYNPPANFLLLSLSRDVPELNKRINERVIEMIKNGWIEETKKLLNTSWQPFIETKKIIGYNEIFDYLHSQQDSTAFNHLVTIISNKTRQYAKRQRTFMRKVGREIARETSHNGHYIGCVEPLNLTNLDINLYINELLQRLSIIMDK